MPVSLVSNLPATNNKVNQATIAGAALAANVTVEAGDVIVVGVVSDNLSGTSPTIDLLQVRLDGVLSSVTLDKSFTQYCPQATAAGGVIENMVVATLPAGTLYSGNSPFTVTLSGGVTAKVAFAAIYRGASGPDVTVESSNSGSFGWGSLSFGGSANDLAVALAGIEGNTAPSMTGVGSNSSATTSGGSGATNAAGRWAYEIAGGSSGMSIGTTTDGGYMMLHIPEYIPPAGFTPVWAGAGIPA